MRYTEEYAKLQMQFHKDRPEYGISGHKWASHVLALSEKMQTRSILDYACGKATLQANLPFAIQNYDPFVPEYSALPLPADIVVCTDVLEHIEPDCLASVLEHLSSLTQRAILFDIAMCPAKKFLPDGRNAHLIQQNSNWWLAKLLDYFQIEQMGCFEHGSLVIVGSPFPEQAE